MVFLCVVEDEKKKTKPLAKKEAGVCHRRLVHTCQMLRCDVKRGWRGDTWRRRNTEWGESWRRMPQISLQGQLWERWMMITWKCSITCNTLAALPLRAYCACARNSSQNNVAYCVCQGQTALSKWWEDKVLDTLIACLAHYELALKIPYDAKLTSPMFSSNNSVCSLSINSPEMKKVHSLLIFLATLLESQHLVLRDPHNEHVSPCWLEISSAQPSWVTDAFVCSAYVKINLDS